MFLPVAFAFGQPSQAADTPASFAPLVEHLSPAVVNISSSQKLKGGKGGELAMPFNVPPGKEEQFRDFMQRFGEQFGQGGGEDPGDDDEGGDPGDGQNPGGQGSDQEIQSLGSGFVIDPAGYIVTNNHVIQDAEEITVNFQDDTKRKAEVVGRDLKTDLALLKVKADHPLPFVSFGDSDKTRVGDWVLCIGNPYGLGGTVTAGIISAKARNINAGPFDDFLQTDASINRGNSGGPMFDIDGHVIGISTAIFSPNGGSIGLGFAVPSDLAKPVIDQLRQFGRTHRGWLGVKIQTVTDEIAEAQGLKAAHGALVIEVSKGSPAEKAGIRLGDIITAFDGHEVKEMRNLPLLVAQTKIGTKAPVTLWRGGKEQTFPVDLGELDETVDAGKPKKKGGDDKPPAIQGEHYLGMTLKTLDPRLAQQFGIKGHEKGVVLIGVEPGGAAAKQGLRRYDVILAVGQQDVSSVDQFKAAIEAAKRSGRDFALIYVAHGESESFITLPTTPSKAIVTAPSKKQDEDPDDGDPNDDDDSGNG